MRAANPAPLQISPVNGSIVNSTKLEWLVPAYSLKATSPYRVQVSSSTDFTVPVKDTTTSNTFYSPQLSEGVWYWRILAKDINNIDSDWSSVMQFTYSTVVIPSPPPTPTPPPSPSVTPSLTPTATPTSLPSPSPIALPSAQATPTSTPNPTVTPTPVPTPTPTPTPTPAAFTITQVLTSINSTQSFSGLVTVVLPTQPNTTFYLKGAFYDDGSTNYFGQTKVNGNWIKNSGSYSSQYKIQTDSQGKWQGSIEFIPDPQDTGFDSSGDYSFKVGRYTSSGSGPTWSDSTTIYINEILPDPSPSPSVFPSASPLPSTTDLTTDLISPIADPVIEEASSEGEQREASDSGLEIDPQIASVEAVATVAGDMEKSSDNQPKSGIPAWWFYLGAIPVFLTGLIWSLIVKYNLHHKIIKWLSSLSQPKTPKNLLARSPSNLNPPEESWPSPEI